MHHPAERSIARDVGAPEGLPPSLVIGSDGTIGRALVAELRRSVVAVLGTTRRPGGAGTQLDLADPSPFFSDGVVRALDVAKRPWAAFLVAGIAGYAACEADPESTRLVNVTNTLRIAEQIMRNGAFLVYPSSSAVFGEADGPHTESSPIEPNSEYGRQKADVEQGLLAMARERSGSAGAAVVRLAKVVGGEGLVGQWLAALQRGEPVETALDLYLSPISLQFAVGALIQIAQRRATGVYHLAGEVCVSYYEFAKRLAASLGADPALVRPVKIRGSDATVASGAAALTMPETTRYTTLSPQTLNSVLRDLTLLR